MPENKDVLIIGAGIAGLTLAYWLHTFGFKPTIVEKRPDLNDQGYMIDFYGSGFDVAEKMGLMDALRSRHYSIQQLEFVDRNGMTKAALPIEKFRRLVNYRHYNFMRGDLADVLYDCVKNVVPIRFNTSISQLHERPFNMEVEFTDGTTETYDLVVGADGIHSPTRSLLWGPESEFEKFLGFYVACAVIDNAFDDRQTFYSRIEPHKQAAIYPIRGGKLATFFAFESDRLEAQSREQRLDILSQVFGDMGWIIPDVLEAMKQSPHLYFDAVSQIRLYSWYRGRVTLAGDACQCLTLLAGQGASMAMTGAYVLAEELCNSNGEFHTAYQKYEARMQPEIDKRQLEAQKLAKSFVPDSYLRIRLMGLFLKFAFLPGFNSIILRQIGAKSIIK